MLTLKARDPNGVLLSLLAGAPAGMALATLFVTLPFVVPFQKPEAGHLRPLGVLLSLLP